MARATIVREIECDLVKSADAEMLGNWSYKSNRILVPDKIDVSAHGWCRFDHKWANFT
jgi:hypothetical protein